MSGASVAASSVLRTLPPAETLLELLPDAVLLLDSEGLVRLANSRMEELFGYPRSALLGQSVEMLIPSCYRDSYEQHWKDFLASPRPVCLCAGLGILARRADGSDFPIQLYLAPLEFASERFVVCSIRQESSSRQNDAALRQREEILRQIPDYIREVFYVMNLRDLKMLYISPAYESIWGRSCQSLYENPMSWSESIHPGDRPRLALASEILLEQGLLDEEYRIVRPDGSLRWISDRAFPVKDADGNVIRTVGIAEDITERKLAKDALHVSEERFRLLVNNARDYAIYMLDPQGRVSSWNAGASSLTGFSEAEILGADFSCFFTSEDMACGIPQKTLRLAAEHGRYEENGWRLRKDGSRFWANAVTSAIRDEHGQLLGFARITRDVTEHKKAEESLLFELGNALLAHRNVQELFSAISASIQKIVPHDYSTLALFDADASRFQLHLLDSWNPQHSALPEISLPVIDSVAGRVFTSGVPLLLARIDEDALDPATFLRLSAAKISSACWLPLIGRERPLGTLMVGSRREAAFSSRDINLLQQISGQIALAVDNALAFRQITESSARLTQHKRYLEDELNLESSFDDIVGESSSLKRVLKQVETVAPTGASVMILGETGTGKELIARAIHRLSARSDRPFVRLSCAAIPAGLLESELFGHERGSFTGAIAQKIGRLELAHKGTLFLDEIGDFPLELQPKILRALQEKEFERVGGARTIPADVRLIAATNRDLARMVSEGQFRSDLYYRLKVFPVVVPPLRERREDIPLLVRYFVSRHSRRMGKRISSISPETMQSLQSWNWPGNIRELDNFIERAVILSSGPDLRVSLNDFENPLQTASSPVSLPDPTLESAEREHILRILRETRGLIGGSRGAAERLGLKRTTLNSKLKKLGITRNDYI